MGTRGLSELAGFPSGQFLLIENRIRELEGALGGLLVQPFPDKRLSSLFLETCVMVEQPQGKKRCLERRIIGLEGA